MSATRAAAASLIFDIGRTNKKVYVFDADGEVRFSDSTPLAEIEDEDGFLGEDLAAVVGWIDERAATLVPRFGVSRINFSTYGATLVHLDGAGQPTTPLYSYLKPAELPGLDDLYRQVGGARTFHVVTGSPPLGMLNSGFQLLWLKHERPAAFRRTHTSLHFPQYLSYRLTGRMASEYTSVGCHTCLWDFTRRRYHNWTEMEGIASLLPDVGSTYATSPAEVAGHDVAVGVGIHDSSAALLVHLRRQQEPFLLVSTGTWAINFNPFNATPLTAYELGRDCLTFMRPDGKPVKASRMFFGREHDVRLRELSEAYGVSEDTYRLVRYDAALDKPGKKRRYQWSELAEFFERGSGQHGKAPNFAGAYHRMMRELVDLLSEQIRLIATPEALATIVIDGGFVASEVFREMLAVNFADSRIVASDNPIGSALGALYALDGKISTV